jgi:hypothetical protein
MDFLKNIPGAKAFIDFGEDAPSKPKSIEQQMIRHEEEFDFKDASKIVSASKVDTEKFKNHFKGLMKEANLQGPDYFEFAQAKDDLIEDIPSEDARIKTANKLLKIPVEKLVESANHYVKIVNTDKENFLKSVSEKEEQELKGRDIEIQQLGNSIGGDQKLIEEKTKVIEANQQRIIILQKEKKIAEEKIKNNQSGYVLAAEEFVNVIKSDVSKIQTILK